MHIFNSILTGLEAAITDQTATSIHNIMNGAADDKTFSNIFPTLASYSSLAGIVIALVVTLLLCLGASRKVSHIQGRFLRISFFVVWIYGLCVYDIGMYTGESISLWTNAPMAILYAFKIFLLDSDVSEIHEAFHGSWQYSFNFALVHVLAAAVSTLFVIKYFGFNMVSKAKMWKEGWSNKSIDDTFVFWGFNNPSEKLIESIKAHYSSLTEKKSYRIILIRLNNDDDDNPETRTGIGRIFDILSIPTSELEKLQHLKCLTTGTYSNISNITVSEDDEDVLGHHLSLRSLRRILEKNTDNSIHMLFLGENEKENLHAVSLLLKDRVLRRFVDEAAADGTKHEVVFYCHARYNSVHRVIEDRFMSGSMRVKVIDSSHISVENLKLDKDLLPVNFVSVEKDATVSTSFNSLVVGFSEVGQDSVRFLYEYGAFVKSGSGDTGVRRSDFHMNVIDRNMSDVSGAFVVNTPGVKISIPFIDGMAVPDALITLNQMDCQSIEFYRSLETWIKTLNYIVIATDDDELNITLAVRIFKLATRYRDNMEQLCILTRIHNDDDGHIREIAEHYNRLLKAQNEIENYNGKIGIQEKIKRNSPAEMPIRLFGLDKETYSYANIIDDSMEQQAIEFKERYTASTHPNYKAPQTIDDYAWHVEIRKNITYICEDKENNPTLSAIMGIRRTQIQDFANCFHTTTKRILAQRALRKSGLKEDFPWRSLTRKSKSVDYKVKDIASVPAEIFTILKVLAQTEHLRWNASHEMLGYVGEGELPTRDEIRMRHSCIKDWEELNAEIHSYDFDIVDLTLNIIDPDRPIEK